MKIISKFKDYYDYCVGKFGRDETRTYDRRVETSLIPEKKRGNPFIHNNKYDQFFAFHICGTIKVVLHREGRFIFNLKNIKVPMHYLNLVMSDGNKTNVNQEYGQPIILEGTFGGYTIPNLSKFGFASYIPAEEMYMMVYNFLGYIKDNPPIQNNQTDKEKVVSHGFDVKKSFRPKMKK